MGHNWQDFSIATLAMADFEYASKDIIGVADEISPEIMTRWDLARTIKVWGALSYKEDFERQTRGPQPLK